MSKLSLACNVVLLIFLAVLALVVIQSIDRISILERQMNQEVSRTTDSFLQEDDFYPCLDKVYSHLEDIWQRLRYLEGSRKK